jgi:SOS-response transcriptional repressor LexA
MCDNLVFMTTIGQNIKNLRMQRGLSQKALAKLCGWESNSRIANYEGTGKTKREPTLSDIKRIARVLNVSAAALAFDDFPAAGEFPAPAIKGLPVLSSSQVKNWPENKQEITKQNLNFLHNKISFGLNCFVYSVEDDSMFSFIEHEGFRKGRQIIFDPDKKSEVNSYVLAKLRNEKIFFRKITDEIDGLALSPLNNLGEYKKIAITEDITIIGVAVACLDVLI